MTDRLLVTFHKLNAQVLALSEKSPKPIVSFDLIEFFENLLLWQYEGFKYPYSNDRFCGLLGKIDIDKTNKIVRLVFVVADADADPQCARDLATNNTRLLHRNPGEAADKRVHVVLKIDPNAPYLADVGIEHETGVTMRIFASTLNYLARHARLDNPVSKQYFNGIHPTERYERGPKKDMPKELGFRLNFKYESILSDEIVDAFINGRVKNVEFSQPPQHQQNWDNQGIFIQDQIKVSLKVKPVIVPSGINSKGQKEGYIKSVIRNLANQHTSLRGVVFKIKFDDSKGDLRLAQYNTDDDEFVLVKKERLSPSLRQPLTANVQLNLPLCAKIESKL
ncbi:hypothetical protein I0P11_07535 [Acinetobacter baumannii]|uniref:hypothetical protein n=1 Tax=Acinetobacter baumannii TaxID=470 RepID=UPI0018B0117D|nr:hypothetical protein [Acinetobacter baumannii]MBF9260990.1 hypothetical protein [Acinetobacter baumannii]